MEKKTNKKSKIFGSMFDRKKIPDDAKKILDSFDEIVFAARDLNARKREKIFFDIKNLSHELTDERTNRRVGYMNNAQSLTAYASYFLWWNLERLVRLFSNLGESAFDLKENAVALDIGSGPLTIPIALWLSRPELREKKITFYCLDISQNALSLGEDLFLQIAAKTLKENREPWKIVKIHGEIGTEIRKKADFVFCANVFNEILQRNREPTDFLSKKYANLLEKYCDSNAKIFLIEPGEPKSAHFISLMRSSLMKNGFFPDAPCPHFCACPMAGRTGGKTTKNGKNVKWCNFAFSTKDAPSALKKLSEKANLPKDRAVLSFLLAHRADKIEKIDELKDERLKIRIASEPIRLNDLGKSGRYACSAKGLLLAIENFSTKNGDLLEIAPIPADAQIDKKSGATIVWL